MISLFSGAGGLDLGFRNAGFDIVLSIESDPSCCDTLRKNNPDLVIIQREIENITSEEILDACKLRPLDAALVIGGPPCQPFSLAGKREGLNDPRGKLLKEFIRVVRDVLPVGFVIENVKGLVNWDKGRAKNLLLDELRNPVNYLGEKYQYTVAHDVLNAVNYGVPQYRERVFFVGNRLGQTFAFPDPQYLPSSELNNYNIKTVWDAIGHLPAADEPSDTAKRVSKTIKGRIENHGY